MPVSINHDDERKVLEINVSGKVTKDDYAQFVPVIERLIKQHGKLRVLFGMHEFDGWTAGALWEDVKFDVKHFNDVERLAIAGEKRWHKGMAWFCKPFTSAQVRYFDSHKPGQLAEARVWLQTGDAEVAARAVSTDTRSPAGSDV
jgi:hypothetical protein